MAGPFPGHVAHLETFGGSCRTSFGRCLITRVVLRCPAWRSLSRLIAALRGASDIEEDAGYKEGVDVVEEPTNWGRYPARTRAPDEPVPATTVDDWALPRLPYRSVRGDIGSALLIASAGIFAAVTGFGRMVGLGAEEMSLSIAVTLGAALALLLKRRVPVVATLAVALLATVEVVALDQLNLGMVLAIADVLYAAGLVGSRTERRIVMALLAVAAVNSAATAADTLEAAIVSAFLLGLPMFLGTAARQRDQIVRAERQRRVAQTERADALVDAAVAERSRAVAAERAALARDLHDGVAAHLSAIALQSGAATGSARQSMAAIRNSSLHALTDLRQLIKVLDTDGSADGLQVPGDITDIALLEADAVRYGVKQDVYIDVPPEALSRATGHVLRKIAHEALLNTARHAPGTTLYLTVALDADAVVLEAVNQAAGVYPDPDLPTGGLGTALMAEQATAVGGVCTAGLDDGCWVVRARVPRA